MKRASAATDASRRRRARPTSNAVDLVTAERSLSAAALAVAYWCVACNHERLHCERFSALVSAASQWRKSKEATRGPAR